MEDFDLGLGVEDIRYFDFGQGAIGHPGQEPWALTGLEDPSAGWDCRL